MNTCRHIIWCLFLLPILAMKGGENMVAIYVALITYKRKTINQVPEQLKKQVLEDLKILGLDGNGLPLTEEAK